VRRLVSDQPSQALIHSTAKVFKEHSQSPEQLTLVYEHLVKEVQKIPLMARQKVRSPRRLVAAFAQAVDLSPSLEEGRILGPINDAAAPIYGWRSPEGPPDAINVHLSSAYLRGRLQLIQGLAENWWGTGDWNPFDQLPAKRTYSQLLERWEPALFGIPRPDLRGPLLASQNTNPNDQVNDLKRACRLIGLLACSPSFQTETVLPTPTQWAAASGRSISADGARG